MGQDTKDRGPAAPQPGPRALTFPQGLARCPDHALQAIGMCGGPRTPRELGFHSVTVSTVQTDMVTGHSKEILTKHNHRHRALSTPCDFLSGGLQCTLRGRVYCPCAAEQRELTGMSWLVQVHSVALEELGRTASGPDP